MADPVDHEQHIAVDADLESTESTYSEELSSYSTSLASSVRNYEWRNGRRYHAYQSGSYNFPNDEAEQDRLDMFHHCIVRLASDGKLFFAPVENMDGRRVLDIGTGTGIWPLKKVGDRHPSAELILGNDLSPIQPPWVPPNLKFLIDDVEAEWAHEKPFDLIHSRYMAASIQDWPKLVKQCFDNLKHGGWVEFQDYDTPPHSEDGTVKPDNNVVKMINLLGEACDKAGRELNPGPKLEQWVKDAGFVNVNHRILKLPVGTWPKDKQLKQIGAFMTMQYTEGIDAVTNVPFTQSLGWKKSEVEVFNAKVKADALDRNVHALHHL
ncbi:hypothetical protein AJ79_03362 [Helicocarpus griseus UAMH5409]|uniref:Methyltransferase domain-containing protein n=1 Tax=Helicocarpus griseus UAMH5409 TaxID=1447875 RepID=A0A2B7XZP5_9EURO|nr:hypothetical protein AJ79_03362 [Helicocarpus griseus UAMH5409]